jgi:stress response protein YsnF
MEPTYTIRLTAEQLKALLQMVLIGEVEVQKAGQSDEATTGAYLVVSGAMQQYYDDQGIFD